MKIIIAGAGSIGKYLVSRLSTEDHSLVVIDTNKEILDDLSSQFDISCIRGNAVSLKTLKEVGVANADMIIAATNSDEANLISGILAKNENPKIKNIARVRSLDADEGHLSEQIKDLFEHFINPDTEAASFLLKSFQVPGASEVIDLVGSKVRLVGLTVPTTSQIVGMKLKELSNFENAEKLLVVAIIRDGELIVPRGEHSVLAGDNVYVASKPEYTSSIFEIVGSDTKPFQSVIIWGGTRIGKRLSQDLNNLGCKVKLIEANAERCKELAEELSGVLVLNGNGTDSELLLEERIEDADCFVAVTEDDEDNILSVILAKKLGARNGALTLSNVDYLNMSASLGIDFAVSPRIAAASLIVKHVRSVFVSSVVSIRDDSAEILEVKAEPGSSIVGKAIKEVDLPSSCLIVAVSSGDSVSVANGDTVIKENDEIVIFANRKGLAALEKFLLKFR